MPYFLGIEGGGTRTTAWIAGESGRVLGRAVAGPSNPLKVGFEASERELLRAARRAIHRASRRLAPGAAGLGPALSAVVVGLAGVDRPPVHRRLLRWLKKVLPARRHLLTSDAAIALAAARVKSPGMIIISGTGSIGYAEDEHGRSCRSGGWGTLYDDAGSGYDLGRKAIVAALRDYDGRGGKTVLGAKICLALGLRDITQIVLKPLTPQKIAGLFPIVLEAARQGDLVARNLCDLAGHDLSELARALVARLKWKQRDFTLVCAGGVFTASPRIRQSFSHFVRAGAPRARVVLLRRPAVEGALALARGLGPARSPERAE